MLTSRGSGIASPGTEKVWSGQIIAPQSGGPACAASAGRARGEDLLGDFARRLGQAGGEVGYGQAAPVGLADGRVIAQVSEDGQPRRALGDELPVGRSLDLAAHEGQPGGVQGTGTPFD